MLTQQTETQQTATIFVVSKRKQIQHIKQNFRCINIRKLQQNAKEIYIIQYLYLIKLYKLHLLENTPTLVCDKHFFSRKQIKGRNKKALTAFQQRCRQNPFTFIHQGGTKYRHTLALIACTKTLTVQRGIQRLQIIQCELYFIYTQMI